MSTAPVVVEQDFARPDRACRRRRGRRQVDGHVRRPLRVTHLRDARGLHGERVVIVKSTPPGRAPRGRHDVLRQARDDRGARRPSERARRRGALHRRRHPPPFFAPTCVAGVAVDPVIEPCAPRRPAELVAARWRAAIDVLAGCTPSTRRRSASATSRVRTPAEELAIWAARRWAPRRWTTTRGRCGARPRCSPPAPPAAARPRSSTATSGSATSSSTARTPRR